MTIKISADKRMLCLDDCEWPVAHWTAEDWSAPPDSTFQYKMFSRQALVKFESGWAASVIWGHKTYSDNYHADEPHRCEGCPHKFTEEPSAVEVGLYRYQSSELVGGPAGWVTAGELTELFCALEQLPTNAQVPDDWEYLLGRETTA